jgi:hypothetical protein
MKDQIMSDHTPILTDTIAPEQLADSLTETTRGSREDPRASVNSSNMIIGVGAVCAVLGMLSLVTQQVWSIVAGEVIELHTPILGRILYAAQITLFVVAVVGLYLHQRKAFNTFGQIATLVALWGTLLWSGSATSETFMTVANGGKPIDHVPPSLLTWVIVVFGLYVLGLFLFGIATWRAGVLPRLPAALVVIGIPLGLTLERFIPGILIVYGVGIAWLGITVLLQLRSGQSAADLPSAPVRA